MKIRWLALLLGLIATLLGACSDGGNAFAGVWEAYTDATRPTLAFFYTDN